MKRKASALWKGTGKDGQGFISTQSGVFDQQPYSFKLRFENEDGQLGTNPEELIAAAHAACFNMALSFQLNAAGFTAESLHTDALLKMVNDGGWVIQSIDLTLTAIVPEITEEQFNELAASAKANCPVSKVLNCTINLHAQLETVASA